MNRSAKYGTAIVLVHLAINVVHGAAHGALHIGLDLPGNIFVALVIVAAPLLAMALLWTSRRRVGWMLLALSMAGALFFGLYHHLMVMSPDQVGQQPPGMWGSAFAVTSYLLALTEGLGVYAGLRYARAGV
jgi:hypothetical protein